MKKGFTLIELLSVIVIIGIISAITAPLIFGVMESLEKGTFEDSVYGIIAAVNLDKAESGFNINRVYTIENGASSPALQTKGKINGTGVVKLDDDGNIFISIQYKNWCANKNYANKEVYVVSEACVENSDLSTANVPFLFTNMVPVKWDGTKWIKADYRNPASNPWYNYDPSSRSWANAVTVKEVGTKLRDYYLSNDAIGEEVVIGDILNFFVWIPRFKYAIPTGSNNRNINILFESGIPTRSVGNAIDNSYLTHEAFTFGDKELSGFWISKFEATGDESLVTSLPNVSAITALPLVNIYQQIIESNQSSNVYGFTPSNTDYRLTKNNEWGAVSYLANSIYGTNNVPIYKNPSSNKITGCSGDSLVSSESAGCSYAYQTANGVLASTTKNIYGVYDMVGANTELVMANYKDYKASSGINLFPLERYYNRYMTSNSITACAGYLCYGHALSETISWYSGEASFVNSINPWLVRGSRSNDSFASQFSYNNTNGGATTNVGYRLSLSTK